MSKVRASVVVPTLDEAGSIPELSQRLRKVLDEEDLDWDVLFVDDGSRDDSFAVLRALHDADSRFKVLRFSRNFGSHIAISAGLDHAEGDVAIVRAAAGFLARGIDPRHLRGWRQSAEREASLFEQRILPLLRQRNPQARQDAVTLLHELADLGSELRAAIIASALRQHLDP